MLIQTVATVSYLPFVAVMVNSLRKHNENVRFSVLVTDVRSNALSKIKDRFTADVEVLSCDDLGIDTLPEMRRYYNTLEFNSACKILAIDYQLNKRQQTECLFLDPDMYARGNIEEVIIACDKDIIITPHTTLAYPVDMELPSDFELVVTGHINGGIVYFRKSELSLAVLAWLVERTRSYWFVAPQHGLYADQQWLSLLPYYFGQAIYVCKDKALNIGYFNLHERPLHEDAHGDIRIEGRDALLFHFSGFSTPSNGKLTRHSNRQFNADTEKVLAKVISEYEDLLVEGMIRFKDLNGDLEFCHDPLWIRMKRAENLLGMKYFLFYVKEGFFEKIGRKLDCLVQMIIYTKGARGK